MRATYSPEDNKLRLYHDGTRLPRDEYDKVRAAGFINAPKQGCFVAPGWTPYREDFCLGLADEIDDEDYSPTERAADRAERFEGYQDKRTAEATGHADTFDAGPAAFGHQSQARAERQARRHDKHRTRAVSQWGKAEYWSGRIAGVIASAMYKSSAPVRRSRILRLEAEQRKTEKEQAEYAARFATWQKVPTLDGSTQAGRYTEEKNERRQTVSMGFDPASVTPALVTAYQLANYSSGYGDYTHPRTGRQASLYSLLTDTADAITPAEAAALWLKGKPDPADPDSYRNRWADHYRNRLAYERAMLEAEGGSAAAEDMEPGGFYRGRQIVSVNKSTATGRVVSVRVQAEAGRLALVNVERAGADAYRAPTDDERAAFATAKKEAKKTAPKEPGLINPTPADAEKLQQLWNAAAEAGAKKARNPGNYKPGAVRLMTQDQYSARSKGDSGYGTVGVNEKGHAQEYRNTGRVTVFKVRKGTGGGFSMYAAPSVVVLTDKPQKPLPWAELDAARATCPTEAAVFPRLGELAEILPLTLWPEDTRRALLDDAVYIGWAWSSSTTQHGWTEEGCEAYKRWAAQPQPEELDEPAELETATAGRLF